MSLNIQRFNPSASELINLIETDVGRPIAHIVPNFVYRDFAQNAEQVLDQLTPIEQEVETIDGRWFVMRMRPYRTVQNIISGVIVTFAEITQQKLAQQELQLLNKVIEEAYTIVIVTGPNGTIEYVNSQYERLLGYRNKEVIGQHFLFNSTPMIGDTENESLNNAIQRGENWRGEIDFLTKNGEEVCFLATMLAMHNAEGAVDRYVLIHDDITDIKQIEKQLRHSEKIYRTLARRLPDVAILVFDHDLNFIVAEGAELENAGYLREKVEGKSFYEIVPKERQAELLQLYEAALNGEERQIAYESNRGEKFRLHAIPLDSDQDTKMGGMIVIHPQQDV